MAPPPRPNLTGFDVRKYVQAAGSPENDPWKRTSVLSVSRPSRDANLTLPREIWRTTGPFSRFNRFKGALPGLGTATVAFAAYCVYEYMFLSKGHHEQKDEGHAGVHH